MRSTFQKGSTTYETVLLISEGLIEEIGHSLGTHQQTYQDLRRGLVRFEISSATSLPLLRDDQEG